MILPALLLLVLGGGTAALASDSCKCIPSDPCWPSSSIWNSLNSTVDGLLIHNDPIAKPCYPGEGHNASVCQEINDNWSDSWWLSRDPVGYSYPLSNACPPINSTLASYPICDLGTAPTYTINATKADHVSAGIAFAREHNIRLVIKNTGHDIQGRSQGYGSLSIWIKYVRDGITFHDKYVPSDGSVSEWKGAALEVAGGYVWDDAYKVAAEHNHIVVGGGDPTVGVIGGYLQGGGHSHASHDYGLAADNVLSMTVVLASGEVIVTASPPTQNPDLFRALRGGGGGTFGVVLSATIKAHPTHPMLAHTLTVIPLKENLLSKFLDIIGEEIMPKYPLLSDEGGFSGYADLVPGWFVPEAAAVGAPGVYTHTFGKALLKENSTEEEAVEETKALVEKELVKNLRLKYNASSSDFLITQSWQRFPTYEAYRSVAGGVSPVGSRDVFMASRLFDKESLSSSSSPSSSHLSEMLKTLASDQSGSLDSFSSSSTTVLELLLVGGGGGGKVLQPTNNLLETTSVNPGWRTSYLLLELVSLPPSDLNSLGIEEFHRDLTERKGGVMREVSPRVGTYLNEADWADDDGHWVEDFWGAGEEGRKNYEGLKETKRKYDPEGVFWCWHCVGSEGWVERKGVDGYGALCRV